MAGSAVAALSPDTGVLIGGRVIQGAGAAMLLPLTLALISDAFPADKRGAAIGIWGGITGLGVAAGPVVGGAVVQGLSWQWIFWINVPVGLILAAVARPGCGRAAAPAAAGHHRASSWPARAVRADLGAGAGAGEPDGAAPR